MRTTINLSISQALFEQIQTLAQHRLIAPDALIEIALEHFINARQTQSSPIKEHQRIINQGDIYWVQLENLNGLEASIPHPHVVIQPNVLNQSRIHTVVVCGLTSNLRHANVPGNVWLEVGEANLPKQSIVEVSKVSSIHKTQLGAYIGTLSEARISQIVAGMQFLQRSFFTR